MTFINFQNQEKCKKENIFCVSCRLDKMNLQLAQKYGKFLASNLPLIISRVILVELLNFRQKAATASYKRFISINECMLVATVP